MSKHKRERTGVLVVDIANNVSHETFICHGRLVVCILELENGFFVTGDSASASAQGYDYDVCKDSARANALSKLMALEVYSQLSK